MVSGLSGRKQSKMTSRHRALMRKHPLSPFRAARARHGWQHAASSRTSGLVRPSLRHPSKKTEGGHYYSEVERKGPGPSGHAASAHSERRARGSVREAHAAELPLQLHHRHLQLAVRPCDSQCCHFLLKALPYSPDWVVHRRVRNASRSPFWRRVNIIEGHVQSKSGSPCWHQWQGSRRACSIAEMPIARSRSLQAGRNAGIGLAAWRPIASASGWDWVLDDRVFHQDEKRMLLPQLAAASLLAPPSPCSRSQKMPKVQD